MLSFIKLIFTQFHNQFSIYLDIYSCMGEDCKFCWSWKLEREIPFWNYNSNILKLELQFN